MTSLTSIAINLHEKSRLLEVQFSNNFSFNYPCEYLRVFSPASGSGSNDVSDQLIAGKANVNITEIHPQGEDSIRLVFDDGFQAIYSWDVLHQLGQFYEDNWTAYLQKLENNNMSRGELATDNSIRTIKIYYFIELVKISKQDTESVEIPSHVKDIKSLLVWLQERGDKWAKWFQIDRVQVTINKHFSEALTPIVDGDEIAIVPLPSN